MSCLYPWLRPIESNQERLDKEFDDKEMHAVFNVKFQRCEIWLTPANSSPYMICAHPSLGKSMRIIKDRMEFDKRRARDILAELDEHNEKVVTDKEDDAMHECRSHLRGVARGRQIFTPPPPRRKAV